MAYWWEEQGTVQTKEPPETKPKYWWEQEKPTEGAIALATTPTKTPLSGFPSFGEIPGLETFGEKLQKAQELQTGIQDAIPLTDEGGKPVGIDLLPKDFGLGEDIQRALFSVSYEGEEIVEVKSRREDIQPISLTFRFDLPSGNIFVYSDFKTGVYDASKKPVGEVNPQTGDITLDPMFLLQTRGYYTRAYGKTAPVTMGGVPIQIKNKLQEFLYTKQVVGERIMPSPAEELATMAAITVGTYMGYHGIRAIGQFLAQSPKVGKLYSYLPGVSVKGQPPPPRIIHDTLTGKLRSLTVSEIKVWKQFQQTEGYQNFQTIVNAANIQRDSALYKASEELLFRGFQLTQQGRADIAQKYLDAVRAIYTGWFVGGQPGQQAEQSATQTINIFANAPRATSSVIAQAIQQIGSQGLAPSAITPSFIAGFVPAGQALTITPLLISELKDLGFTAQTIKDMNPNEAWANVLSGLTPETITGEVPTGVQFNPITTPVGKGYEIIQNGEKVGEVSYSTEVPGVTGTVLDRIDIVETARRQGLATQVLDRILAETETQGVPLYTGMLEADGVKLINSLEQRGIINLTPAPQRMLGQIVTRGVAEYAPTTAMVEWGGRTGAEEAAGMEEYLDADPVATYTVHVGKKRVHLDYFLKNGEWPETFTVKEAAALMQKPEAWVQSKIMKAGLPTNRVDSAYVLDEIAGQFNLSEQDFINRLQGIYRLRQRLQAIPAEVTPEAVKPTAPAVKITAPAVSPSKLRQSIWATAKVKGLSTTATRDIIKRISGGRELTGRKPPVKADTLQKILTAIQKARPVTIGQKKVVTPRTEQEIQDIKQSLIDEKKITQADYDAILRMLKLSTDRYVDRTAFITETQGLNIIKAMKRKSFMGYAFVEQRINELVNDMKPPDEPPQIITSESLKQPFGAKFIDKIQAFTIRSYRMERILYRLDGYEDTGIWQDTFYKPVNEATSARIGEVIEWQDKFLQYTKQNKINIGRLFTAKEDFGDGVILTPSEKIGVYLHSLNPDNLRHLKVGNRFSDALIKRVVDSLTPEEKSVANFQQDYYKQSGTPLAETYKYMTGKDLELVENYFPITLDWRADPEIDWWQLVSLADSRQFMAKWASSMIPKGFLSARTHEATQAVSLDAMSIWWNHLELTAHYKSFSPVINDLQLIMQNPKFKHTLQNTQSRHLYQVLDKWIKQVADVNPLRATNYAEQMMRTIRVNAVAAVLGINITTALKQFPSFVSSMSEAGVIPVMRGLFTFLSHPKETTTLMKQLSPQIYARTMEREIAEARLKASLDKKLTRKLSPREAFMFLTTTMDRLAVNSIWRGVFDEHLRQHPTEVTEAAEYASRVIRRTQPFFSVKDLAEYYRSGEFMKVLTIFTNQLNQYWNMARFEMFGKFGAKPGPKEFGDLVKRFILGIVIPAVMIGIITRARLPKDIEDIKDDVVRTAMSSIPIFGQWLSSGFQGWVEGRGLISTELFSQLQGFIYNLNQEEWDRLALQIPELAGYIAGIPVAQPKRTIEGIIDILQGETDDWLRLIYSEYTRDAGYREMIEGWQKDFTTYYEQSSPRYDYREANPEVDAKLFISNKVSTLQSDEARNIVLRLIRENDIDVRRISAYEKVFGEPEKTHWWETTPETPTEETAPAKGGYWWE